MCQLYIEQLWLLHRNFDNVVEYGIGLQLHASFYSYASTTLLQATNELPAEQEGQRKMRLSLMAVDAFDQGEVWERSLAICQDIALACQHVLYDLPQCSSILRRSADFFDKIHSTDRIFRAHYRVAFYGRGFGDADIDLTSSPILGSMTETGVSRFGREFVYRSGNGRHKESVKDFTDRIKQCFPNAQVVNSPDLPPDAIVAPDYAGQYIQIITLVPATAAERDAGMPVGYDLCMGSLQVWRFSLSIDDCLLPIYVRGWEEIRDRETKRQRES
jgi:hypothetical protein